MKQYLIWLLSVALIGGCCPFRRQELAAVTAGPSRPRRPDRSTRGTRDKHRLIVALTFDFDAESIWLAEGKKSSPSAVSRGTYGATEGLGRILRLLEKHDLPATFFVPGSVAERHPEKVRAIARAGHEIGHHGYLHTPPIALRAEEEASMLKRGIEALEQVTGRRPSGFRAPSALLSPNTLNLLREMGFTYDSSQFGADRPYRVSGQKGPSAIVEIPISVELTDSPHFLFLFDPIVLPGLSSPSKVEQIWRGDFDGLYAEGRDGVFNLTCHPQIIGRPHRMQMLERFILYILGHDGVWFARMQEIADYAKQTKSQPIGPGVPTEPTQPPH